MNHYDVLVACAPEFWWLLLRETAFGLFAAASFSNRDFVLYLVQ